jgi:hypothetical protein
VTKEGYSGRSFIPAPTTLKIGRDVAFVPVDTVALMEEQVGGIEAAILNAGEKIQTTAQVAGERLQETAQVTGDKLQAAGRIANAKVTNAIVDRAAQRDFVLGKVAQQKVELPNGDRLVVPGEVITSQMVIKAERVDVLDRLYRAAGGSLTEPLGERMGTTVAGLTIEQAQGRRAQRAVYTPEGYIIAAQGQIVTTQAIDRAKAAHQESALLDAVGLSTSAAAQSKAGVLATTASDRLKTTTADTTDRIQTGAANMWDRVKETANDLQQRSAQAVETKRIKGALGRPTTRVILDPNDEVILNVGELISHKAIATARTAGILDVLLDSVYTETPQLSIDELRAPEKGKAALQ